MASRKSLPPQIRTDRRKIYEKLIEGNIISPELKPVSKNQILMASDLDIISYYNSLGHGLLSYYRCCDDLFKVKNIVRYFLRFSLIRTLKNKHKLRSTAAVFRKYGPALQVSQGGRTAKFLNLELIPMEKEFLNNGISDPFRHIGRVFLSMQNSDIYRDECAISGCETRVGIEIHHIRKLYRGTAITSKAGKRTVIVKGKSRTLSGAQAFESALTRKQLPLCRAHHVR